MDGMDQAPKSLRDRAAAPATVDRPLTPGVTWRSATAHDAAAITALEREAGAVDHPRYVVTLEEMQHDLTRDGVDLDRDSLVGFDENGALVAYALSTLLPFDEVTGVAKVVVDGSIRLDRRGEGIGQALMRWHEARGRQQLASVEGAHPGWLITFADEAAADKIGLYAQWDYELRRWWFELTRALDEKIGDVPLDPALRLEPFTAALSERTRLARNDVFRDHWGSQATPAADWEVARALPTARPDLSFVAVDPASDEVVAFVLSSVNEEEWAAAGHSFGYIDYVGVRRGWRGRKVAQALLNHTMRSFRDAGLSHATLDVDSESPTGATGLYAGLGFTPINRSVSLVKNI